ncbi:MAG: EamA family transporter [Deltaproteobacteria bacterium]|nr:EamA family transporter [Deltaproteobacteria bacterium]
MWFILSLFSALFQVLRNMVMKQIGHSLDETINVWGRFTFLLPFAGVGVLLEGMPEIKPGFWTVALLFGITQTLATLSLSKALKVAEISLVTALWKLSLILLVAWGYFWLGERPSLLGVTGVSLSMVGVYLLNIHRARVSFWAPLLALVREPGQRWTLLSAMGYAPSVVLIKDLAQLSSPGFAVFMGYVVCSAMVTPYTIYRSARHFRQVGRHLKAFVGLGLFSALSTWIGTTAYLMTHSSYVEAVKQVEVVLALLIGYAIFHEGARIRLIWPGTVIMLAGLVLLKLGG